MSATSIIILLLVIAICTAGIYMYKMTPVVITQQVPVEVPVYTTPIGWDYGSPALYWRNRIGGRWGGGWRGGRGWHGGGRGRR